MHLWSIPEVKAMHRNGGAQKGVRETARQKIIIKILTPTPSTPLQYLAGPYQFVPYNKSRFPP